MNNPFSLQNLAPTYAAAEIVRKGGPGSGENPGHPFRGNQFSEGEAAAKAADTAHLTTQVEPGENRDHIVAAHKEIAEMHRQLAQRAIEKGDKWVARHNNEAAKAHDKAARLQGHVSGPVRGDAASAYINRYRADKASYDAQDRSAEASFEARRSTKL